jgi:hypothetical protein
VTKGGLKTPLVTPTKSMAGSQRSGRIKRCSLSCTPLVRQPLHLGILLIAIVQPGKSWIALRINGRS